MREHIKAFSTRNKRLLMGSALVLVYPSILQFLQTIYAFGASKELVGFASLPAFFAPFLWIGALVWAVIRAKNDQWERALIVFALLVLVIPSFWLGKAVRMEGMRRFAERARPVVTAVKQFEHDHGRPPKDLGELVPQYLPKVLGTGMPAFPEMRCFVREPDWFLSVSVSGAFIPFDQLVYHADGNYGSRYPGYWQPVGEWAYLRD